MLEKQGKSSGKRQKRSRTPAAVKERRYSRVVIEGKPIFRTFQRQYRPLSAHLHRTFAEPVLIAISGYMADQLGSDTTDLVAMLVSKLRVDGPRLLGSEPGRSGSGEGDWRPGQERSVTVSTNRHYVAIQVAGEIELLEHWPDKGPPDLRPVDDFDENQGREDDDSAPYDQAAAVLRHDQRLTRKLWFLGQHGDNGSWALYTFIDLTFAEEQEVADGRLNPRAIVDSRRAAIEPIVEAIREQTRLYFDEDLPAILAQAVEQRRALISARAAVRANLTWPEGWKFDEPKVTIEKVLEANADGSSVLHVEHRSRLDPATFDDVQRTIRVWADAVERYPAAFRGLHEDRLSDLLAATLNASLPGASREVYSRGGKSDIFIRAEVLQEGLGPAKVLICESKWWAGPKEAVRALNQLLGYLEVKDTAAVLVFFVRHRRPAAVRPKAYRALTGASGYRGRGGETVAGWPIHIFTELGRQVAVCSSFIDLPPG